jgi:hypothetical protein
VLTFASCGDILDYAPTGSVTDTAVWNDAALIGAYHTELYSAIEAGHRGWTGWLSRGCDETFPAQTGGPSMYQNGDLNPDNRGVLGDYWNKAYQYIRKINVFFANMETTQVTLPDKDRLIAEAKYLKAWIYFVMMTRFKAFPLVDDTWGLDEAATTTFTSNTHAECLTAIEKLIAEAVPDLPDYIGSTAANFGRPTKDVCRALLSRLYLYAASPLFNDSGDTSKWQKAADAAMDFMKNAGDRYELYPSYRDCFIQPSGKENKEFIWTRQYSSNNGHNSPMDNLGRRYGAYGGWNATNGPSQNLVDDYDVQSTGMPAFRWVNGEKEVNPGSGYDPQNPYNDRDPRMDGTVIHDGTVYRGDLHEMWEVWEVIDGKEQVTSWGFDSSLQDGDNPRSHYILKKFMPEADIPISWQIPSTIPWPFFRLAEIYLNYAEAMFELGDEATCREYMNKVRARAEMPPIPDTVTGEELRARLYNERRVEFAFEEHRIFDVRRWKIAVITENRDIYGMQIVKKADGTKTYTPVLLFSKQGKYLEKMNLIPIATSEIQRNIPKGGAASTLIQTEGWR